MDYIVLDMEWNQPFSKTKKEVGGVFLKGEIIQIGAVRLNSDLQLVDSFKTNIKPKYYKRINRHVREITGLTSDVLCDCNGFEPELNRFLIWCGNDYEFINWGNEDMPMLRDNMSAYGFDISVLPRCYNLQVIFNKQITLESRQWSLSDAMEKLGIEQEYRPHDALNDAVNTAKIAMCLDISEGIRTYADNLTCKTVSSVRISGFDTARGALRDPRIFSLTCPICDKKLPTVKWLGVRNKRLAVTACKEHGTFKFRTVVFPENGKYTVKRKICFASTEDIESYTTIKIEK